MIETRFFAEPWEILRLRHRLDCRAFLMCQSEPGVQNGPEHIGDLGDIGFPSAFPKPTPCPGQCRLAIAWASQGSSWDTSARAPHGATRSPCWRRSSTERLHGPFQVLPCFTWKHMVTALPFGDPTLAPPTQRYLVYVRDAENCVKLCWEGFFPGRQPGF